MPLLLSSVKTWLQSYLCFQDMTDPKTSTEAISRRRQRNEVCMSLKKGSVIHHVYLGKNVFEILVVCFFLPINIYYASRHYEPQTQCKIPIMTFTGECWLRWNVVFFRWILYPFNLDEYKTQHGWQNISFWTVNFLEKKYFPDQIVNKNKKLNFDWIFWARFYYSTKTQQQKIKLCDWAFSGCFAKILQLSNWLHISILQEKGKLFKSDQITSHSFMNDTTKIYLQNLVFFMRSFRKKCFLKHDWNLTENKNKVSSFLLTIRSGYAAPGYF